VIICEIIVHLLVIVQNNKRCTVQRNKFYSNSDIYFPYPQGLQIRLSVTNLIFAQRSEVWFSPV